MPIIVVTRMDSRLNKETIDRVEKVAGKVFNLIDGILPLPVGTVEIIPDFRREVSVSGPPFLISVFLYRKEDRTPALLARIVREFAREFKEVATIRINDQPEELHRTI